MSKVVIALANGCEEIEALTVADVLFHDDHLLTININMFCSCSGMIV